MGLLDRYVNTLTDDEMGPYSLNDDDRKKLKKRSLLQLGLGLLSTPTGQGGVFQAFGKAAAGAAQDVQQGGQQMMKQKYQADQMKRYKAEQDKQTMIDGLGAKYRKPDGTMDMQGFQNELDAIDPLGSLTRRGGNNELQSYDRYLADLKSPDPRVRQAAEQKLYLSAKPTATPYEFKLDSNNSPNAFDKRTGSIAQADSAPQPNQQIVQMPSFAPKDVRTQMQSIAMQFPNVRASSFVRTPERNAQVGGVKNSQHITGTAGDFVVPQTDKPAFIQAARAKGFEAIDEGDHVHVELPPNAPRVSHGFNARTPEDIKGAEARAAAQAKADVELETVAGIKTAEVTAAENAKNAATQQLEKDKKLTNANNVLSLLDSAEETLNSATSSGFGAMRDSTMGFFGASTEGADATAALDVIAGQLVLSQPRMEGPQSDADRLLYAKMAGNLADNTRPISQRKAAFTKMKELAQRYIQTNQTAAPARRATDMKKPASNYSSLWD